MTSSTKSKNYRLLIGGDYGCFTRPEFKVERVTYDVITPSAARGIVDGIYWKPAIKWSIHEIAVLNLIKKIEFRRNEVNSKASERVSNYCADEDRAQRNTVALKDPKYVITVSFSLTEDAGERDDVRKHEEIFERRLGIGQYHQSPCLGCREFAADVRPAPAVYAPQYQGVTVSLGKMLWGIEYKHKKGDSSQDRALWFAAVMKDGIIHVPSSPNATSPRS